MLAFYGDFFLERTHDCYITKICSCLCSLYLDYIMAACNSLVKPYFVQTFIDMTLLYLRLYNVSTSLIGSKFCLDA